MIVNDPNLPSGLPVEDSTVMGNTNLGPGNSKAYQDPFTVVPSEDYKDRYYKMKKEYHLDKLALYIQKIVLVKEF